MKRLLLLVLVLLMVVSFAIAETVVKYEYTLITPDYTRSGFYTGEIQNGQPEGYGVFDTYNSDGIRWHYIGYWVNGLMQGDGGTYWDDGAVQIGIYVQGYMIDGYALDGASTFSGYVAPAIPTPTQIEETYIGNRKTKKFHHAWCDSVGDILEQNKISIVGRDEAISLGYVPCKRCEP